MLNYSEMMKRFLGILFRMVKENRRFCRWESFIVGWVLEVLLVIDKVLFRVRRNFWM